MVRLSGLELKRPRIFGSCWLACELWQQLGLDEFWQQRLPEGRETVSWEKVLRLLVVNRLLDPGSEFRVHRQWYVNSAMDELLETGFEVAEKDRRCRCLDRVLDHKQELFVDGKIHLPEKDEEVTRTTFTFHTDKVKLKSAEQRDGHYLLGSKAKCRRALYAYIKHRFCGRRGILRRRWPPIAIAAGRSPAKRWPSSGN